MPQIVRNRALLVVALSLLGTVACATAPHHPLVRDPAAIEVANRAPVDYDVFVDGQHVAQVRSGDHALIDGLRSGAHRVTAEATQDDAPERRTDVDLALGGSALWDILPEPPTAPVDVARGFGSVRLINEVGEDLDVRLDGALVARLLTDDTRLLTAVSAGERTVIAERGLGHIPLKAVVTVLPGQLAEVRLDGPRGKVELRNATGEALDVSVDGRLVGTVESAHVRTFDGILAGARTLTAEGETTQRVYTREQRVVQGEVGVWDIEAAAGGIQVLNDTPEAVRVWIDEMEIGRVPSGESKLFSQISLGSHTMRALTLSSGLELRMPVDVRTDQTFVWPLTLDEGVLILENRTEEAVQTYLDGEPFERLEAGVSRTVSQLPAGKHSLSAFGELSHRIVPHTAEIAAARASRWTIDAVGASVVIRNDRTEPVRLYLDAVAITQLGPGEERVMDGLVAGERLVEARGEHSGRVWRERATFDVGTRRLLVIRDPSAALTIVNHTGEALRVDPALARQGDVVPRSASRTYDVPVVRKKVSVTGDESGFEYEQALALEDGETKTWVIERPLGAIEIFNHRDEVVNLWLDGAPVGTIAAEGSLLLEHLRLGRHELLATGRTTGHGTRSVRRVEAGDTNNWQIGHQVAILVVVNQTDEEQEVLLDDRPYGRTAAGERRAFGGIPAGARMLKLKGKRSLEVQEAMLQFEEGRTERFRVEPLRGSLQVRNERAVPVSIFVDGERVGEAPARGVYENQITQGGHTVETRDADTLAGTLQRLQVSPYQTYEVRVPRTTGTLRASNMTDLDLEIRADDHILGTIAPGSTRLFHGVEAGRRRIHATHGHDAWSLDTIIDGAREQEWVISPAPPRP